MAGIIYSSVLMLSSKNHISDFPQQNVNYPTLSLKQDLIDAAFSGATYGFQKQQEKRFQKQQEKSLSPNLIRINKGRLKAARDRMKKHLKIQTELRLQSG